MANEFYEYEEIEAVEDAAWKPEHDFTIFTEEAECSDAIPFDEDLDAALAAEFEAVLESQLEQDEDPAGFDDIPEDEDDPDSPIGFDTLRQQIDEFAVERLSKAARKDIDFDVVIGEMDRLDRNRERRERYHEVLRGDVPLEYKKKIYDGLVFPEWMCLPKHRILTRGQFLDILFDCPYEMHELTADRFLSNLVKNLKMEHKEILYFLSLRLYSATKLAELRGQSNRNVRKVRDTYTRKLQRKLYDHLKEKQEEEESLSLREREFIELYEVALEQKGKTEARVKKENKFPRRKKATLDDSKSG